MRGGRRKAAAASSPTALRRCTPRPWRSGGPGPARRGGWGHGAPVWAAALRAAALRQRRRAPVSRRRARAASGTAAAAVALAAGELRLRRGAPRRCATSRSFSAGGWRRSKPALGKCSCWSQVSLKKKKKLHKRGLSPCLSCHASRIGKFQHLDLQSSFH